jgi:magnesium chelatase family protein
VPVEALERVAVFGELSLSGAVRPVRGALAVAEGVARAGLAGLLLAPERVAEALLIEGIGVAAVASLEELAAALAADEPPGRPEPPPPRTPLPDARAGPDLADVRGQRAGVQALQVAAAGEHNLFMQGPPGTGKTMLARRLPSILPALEGSDAVEVTRIHSVAGIHNGGQLIERRPFRAPHHTISPPGLVGGGGAGGPYPGEVTLAHRGVLFLDELAEFSRSGLEALRQPLEDGVVQIVRGQRAIEFPARFMLVAAGNPCRCGFAPSDRCTCTEAELAAHRRRLSGPLLDRIDVRVAVERPAGHELTAPPQSTSQAARDRVLAARERQRKRLAGTGYAVNGRLDARGVRDHVRLTLAGHRALQLGYEKSMLSARGHHRVLRVARTIADLDGDDRVGKAAVLEALSLREKRVAAQEAAA